MRFVLSGRSTHVFPVFLAVVATMLVSPGSTTIQAQTNTAFHRAWDAGTPATVTGVVTVIYADDFAGRRAALIHKIRDERTGQSFQLHFEQAAPSKLTSGKRLRISGRSVGSELYIARCCDSGTTVSSTNNLTASTLSTVIGNQQTLVVVANFRDKAVSCSIPAVRDLMFTHPLDKSVDDLYKEMSAGKVSLSGTVVGPYNLNYASTDPCDIEGWASAANAAAAGTVDLSAYPRKLYVLPSSSCPAAGTADFGVTPSRAWIFTCDLPDVYAHELGHNLGMQHAATPDDEYGDLSDVMGMGFGTLRQIDAPHKMQLGWIPDSNATVITQDGLYDVASLELDPTTVTNAQVLKVFKADTNEYYYLSFRQAIGFDANLVCCPYLDRLNVHRWSGGTNKTYLVAALLPGETFEDPANGLTFTHIGHTSATATADIRLGDGCRTTAPSVEISPVMQTGSGGSARTYDVTLVNNDQGACAAAAFGLAQSIPSGWTGTVTPASIQLMPGAIGHASATLTSPINVTSGTYEFAVNLSDVTVTSHSASAAASYTVASTCTNAPTTVISPSTQIGSPGTKLNYSVTVTNMDDTACATTTFTVAPSVPASWDVTLSPSTIVLAPGASGVATYSVASPPGSAMGTYGIWARVSDSITSIHEASAAASYVIQTDSIAPEAPTGLLAKVKGKQVTLLWRAATDNIGVAGYRVSRNGVVIATSTTLSWVDQPSGAQTYTYFVIAYDAAGNLSPASNSVAVTMSGGGKGR